MTKGHPFFGGPRRGYHHGRLKDALLEAARALVAERGPAGFTLAEAAKLVGVTAAAPYRHFADRNELLGELARRGFELFGQRLAGAWDQGRVDPSAALRRLGTAYLAFARQEPGLYTAMFGNARMLDAPAPGRAATNALEILRMAAAAVLAQKGGANVDARRLAFEIWSLSHGVAMLTLSGYLDAEAQEGLSPEDLLSDAATALVEAAIRRRPAGPWARAPAE
jgi:AcrR family transcriptional regulator